MHGQTSTSSPFSELHHIAIVVRDIEAAVRFYESIGIGPFKAYPAMREYVQIRVPEEEGFYNLIIKWAQIGPLQLQLIQPGEGASLYKTFLEKRGEGVFHLGFAVPDIDRAEIDVADMDLKVLSSGRRADGSGFAYLDTAAQGGVTLLIRQSPPAG
jgi:catechol 2,3-dioxygenase-like lactoylglutathione lyase family enzyme